jgi:outer membrane protein
MRFKPTIRSTTLGVSFLAFLCLSCWAQEPPSAPTPQNTPSTRPLPVIDYTRPVSHFPNPVGPYTARHVAAPNLANTARIDSLLRDGKLYLSLNDAIALALENNLDIAIARYNLNIADTDVLRAKAGATTLGVNTGIVQNTPGGGVGGLGGQVGSGTGGTSLGAGGAGAGAGGLVGSTLGFGPQINSFDPILTGTLQEDHFNQLTTNLFQGVAPIGAPLVQNTGTVNFAYQQEFMWGTNLNVAFNNARTTTNSAFQGISPQIVSNFKATFTQHILQGFGFAPNTRFIRIAKNNRELSDVAFRLQVTTTVDQIENMYWDLVYAYENLRVKQESLSFSQKTLSDTQKQVEIGSLAPIESVRAQSTLAADQQSLTVAKTNLQLQQLLMKNALSRTLHDPALANSEVVPTSTMEVPGNEEVQPTEDLVNDALRHRPELVESRIQLNSQELSNKAVRSALLPTLDLYAYYGGNGLGGTQNPLNACANPPTQLQQIFGCASPGSQFDPVFPSTGLGGTYKQLIDSSSPDKGIGLQLNIPLRNRAAQAVQIRSELEYRQLQMALQQTENRISIEVRNAQFGVEQNRASVASAQAAVDYAKQSLDAEQKKYQFGTSTTTLVLQNRSALATAESTLLSAMAAYEKSRIELDRSTGTLLEHENVSIDDAARGQVTRLPNVPYVAPRKDLPDVTPQTATPPPIQPQQ